MSDPIRLSDPRSKSSPALRNLIRAGQKDLPDQRQLAALALHLGPVLGVKLAVPSAGATSALGGANAGVGWVAGAKLGAAGVVLLGLTSAVYVHEYRLTGPQVERQHEKSVATANLANVATAQGTNRELPSAGFAPMPAAGAAAAGAPQAVVGAAPRREPVQEASAPRALAIESPLAPRPVVSTSEPIPGAAEIPSPLEIANPPPESEITLLQRAADRLRSDPRGALDLAELHTARFPSGALAQEREVIAIEALAGLHREAEARDRAERFARDFPGSAHRLHIQSFIPNKDPAKSDHNP